MNLDKMLNYLKLDDKEFSFQFKSHPNYPSALALSDTLNFMGIKNDAYELEKEFWEELPKEFIGIFNNSFALIQYINNNQYKIYSDVITKTSKEDLYAKSNNFVLLFERTESVLQKPEVHLSYLFFMVIVLMLFYSFFSFNFYHFVFNILSMAGLYISLDIFNNKFGTSSIVLNNICDLPYLEKHNNDDACTKIIEKDKINVFGLKLSDFSLIYFSGLSILGLFFPASQFVIICLSLFSMIVVGYSLFYQIFIGKTFCKICFVIISVLIAQLFIGLYYFNNINFDFENLLLGLSMMLSSILVIIFMNNNLKEKQSLQESNVKNLRFKRNFELFRNELFNQEKIEFNNKDLFFIGNRHAKLHIDVVSNPYCGFCEGAHKIIQSILDKYPDDVSVQIRFNYSPETADAEYTELMSLFVTIYLTDGENAFLSAVEKWFRRDSKDQVKAEVLNIGENDMMSLANITKENIKANLSFTPVFVINGRQFPKIYDREDLIYFIEDLIYF